MKTIYQLAVVMLAVIAFGSCIFDDPQPEIMQVYDLEDFTEIELGDALHIEIRKGLDFKVVAEGEKNDIQDLILEVQNGKLTGRYRPGSRSHGQTRIYIELPELSLARLHSATRTTIRGFDDTDQTLNLEISGSSMLTTDVRCKLLYLGVSGASKVVVTGKADCIYPEVSGKSELLATDFKVNICEIGVSGKSDATVSVSNELKGTVNGNSSLTYSGNPVGVEVDVANDSELIKQ